ncbi:MAG: glycosyltransferase family 4 protein, partial [Anaerovoracaceae bacterium]
KPDIVIASSTYPLDIYPAHKIAKAAGGKLVFELHDLWPLSPMELNGYSKNHPFIVIMQRGEDYACKHSDAIVSLLPRADMHLVERGMAKEKFHWVSNGIVKEDWDKTEPIPELMEMELNKYKEEGQFLIGYAGNHGDANSLDSFIDVVAGLKDKKIMGILVGTGAKKDYFVKKVASEGITNVKFFDPIGKPQIPDFLSHLDCLYNGVKNISLFRFGTSFNKIYDYMMAGKPIICAVTAPNDTVGDAGCGYSIEGENDEALREAILKLYQMTEEERKIMGDNGKRVVMEEYEYTALSRKFMNILEEVKGEN